MNARKPRTLYEKVRLIVLATVVPVVIVWGAWTTIPLHDPAKLPFVLTVTLAGVAMVTFSIRTMRRRKVSPATLSFLRSLILILGCGFIFFGVQWLTAGALAHLQARPAGETR